MALKCLKVQKALYTLTVDSLSWELEDWTRWNPTSRFFSRVVSTPSPPYQKSCPHYSGYRYIPRPQLCAPIHKSAPPTLRLCSFEELNNGQFRKGTKRVRGKTNGQDQFLIFSWLLDAPKFLREWALYDQEPEATLDRPKRSFCGEEGGPQTYNIFPMGEQPMNIKDWGTTWRHTLCSIFTSKLLDNFLRRVAVPKNINARILQFLLLTQTRKEDWCPLLES